MFEEHNQTPGRAGTNTQTQNMLEEHKEGMVGGHKNPHPSSVACFYWNASSVDSLSWRSSSLYMSA